MWFENNKCPIHSEDIYLELPRFQDLCSKLNVEASKDILEAYKKHSLLYPTKKDKYFYSPWQVYLLEEANHRYTHKINVLIPLRDETKKFKSFSCIGLMERIFPFCRKRSPVSENPYKLKLSEWQDHFKALWEYRFKESLLFKKFMEQAKNNILEGELVEKFYEECKKAANEIYSNFSYVSWIDFLRALCELYFVYQRREKVKLSKCLKSDIRKLIDILMYSTSKPYREIISDVGSVLGGIHRRTIQSLEAIIPEYESFLRRESKEAMEVILNEYNKEMPSNLKLDKDAIDEIIEYAIISGNETLLISIIGVNKEWFSPSYFGIEGIWSYIRSLATAVESWVKMLSGRNGFREAIIALASGDFDSCCEQLQRSCGRTNMKINSYADLQHFLNELSRINLQIGTDNHSWMKFLIRAYLIRNYVAHHTKIEPELFGTQLIEIYKSLLFLVFYAWKVK